MERRVSADDDLRRDRPELGQHRLGAAGVKLSFGDIADKGSIPLDGGVVESALGESRLRLALPQAGVQARGIVEQRLELSDLDGLAQQQLFDEARLGPRATERAPSATTGRLA